MAKGRTGKPAAQPSTVGIKSGYEVIKHPKTGEDIIAETEFIKVQYKGRLYSVTAVHLGENERYYKASKKMNRGNGVRVFNGTWKPSKTLAAKDVHDQIEAAPAQPSLFD